MKKVLITGVAQGFGKYLAVKFIKAGYSVCGIDRIPIDEIDPELKQSLDVYRQIDLSDISNLPLAASDLFSSFAPDILINNAALKFFKKFEDTSINEILSVTQINYLAPLLLTKIWLSTAPKGNKLTCIMMSSNAAYYGYTKGSLYCSSKSAIRLFSESIKEEYSSHRLQIITLCPETFKDVTNSAMLSGFSMDTVYNKLQAAISTGKSVEIALLKPKTKLRYCFYETKKFINWFLRK